MRRSDVAVLRSQFQLIDGQLFRQMSTRLRAVDAWRDGRLVVVYQKTSWFAAEIAWAVLYGTPCPHYVLVLDGNEKNLTPDNLFPVVGSQHRFRLTPVAVEGGDGFRHPLSSKVFFDKARARADWAELLRPQLEKDKAELLETWPAPDDLPEVVKPGRKAPVARTKRKYERRPPCPEGWALVRYKGGWLAVPRAVHPSDDVVLRCQWVKQGVREFRFDAEKQMTLPVLEGEADFT